MGHILSWDPLCPVDNHDIISIKLFQLTVERTPEEESIDWTKIEPGVSFLKSPKGVCACSPALQGSSPAVPARAGLWALNSVAGGQELGPGRLW